MVVVNFKFVLNDMSQIPKDPVEVAAINLYCRELHLATDIERVH